MRILNLTQHLATDEQVKAGVHEPNDKIAVKDLLTFHTIPTVDQMERKAKRLTEIAQELGFEYVMVGGAGYFMPVLERVLLEANIIPLHSFTERKTIEKQNADGTVEKVSIFQHIGWVGLER